MFQIGMTVLCATFLIGYISHSACAEYDQEVEFGAEPISQEGRPEPKAAGEAV